MISKNIFFIYLIFSISLASCATLSMSPPQIDFIGNTQEMICQNVIVKVNETEKLIGKTLWAPKGNFERKLSSHRLFSDELGLKISLPGAIEITDREEIEICIEGKNPGDFHGVLLYKIENKPAQVGIWINVSLEGNNLMKITGNFVKPEDKINSLFILPCILLIILILLIIKYRKRIR